MVEFAYFGQTRTSSEELRRQQEAADRALLAPTPTKVYTVPNIPNVPTGHQTTDADRRQELSPTTPSTGRQTQTRPGASTGQRVLTFFTDVTRSIIPGGNTGAGQPVTMPSTTMPSTQMYSPLAVQSGVVSRSKSPVMTYVLIGGGVLLAIGAAIAAAKLLKKKSKVEK